MLKYIDNVDFQELCASAERVAEDTGWKHAVFLIPPYGSLPEAYRISKSNDHGYYGMGAKRLYVTEHGVHPY